MDTSPKLPVVADSRPSSGRRIVRLTVGGIVGVVAVVCLVGGGWALWKDRVDRDGSGFVTIRTSDLGTQTYAIVGDLRGDGPAWLYGSSVIGDERVRATSSSTQPLFIGIARKTDVARYLSGVGYATIYNFEVTSHTTHAGGPPPSAPSREAIWAATAQGAGEQTLFWTPRDGDWSVVLMNADASAGVAVHGSASAKLPILPWVAGGLLVLAIGSGLTSAWVVVRELRRKSEPTLLAPDESQGSVAPPVPVGAPS